MASMPPFFFASPVHASVRDFAASADAFAAFEESGRPRGSVLDAETGERFWNEILAVGGSRPALESFKAFRGREPQVDALLRHSGMVAAS